MVSKIVLILIIILAIFLRFWDLNILPPSLNWDEVSIGYNAYSVLKTGRDEWGELMPLSFRAFGDYKLPAYVYLDIPFVYIFGLNEWGVRLPSALLGVGLVILTYLILRNLTNIRTAVWGALIVAILPWTIILSIIALEANLALFLTVWGFYLFILGLRKNKFLILSAIIFGLTVFTYNSSRIVTPMIILLLGIIYFQKLKNKKITLLSLVIFLAFFVSALPRALLQDSSARYRWTAVLDEGAINHINEARVASTLPFPKLIHNKVTYFITESSKNYIAHFNPDFLFLNGGSNYQFSVPGSGLIYPFFAPFLFLGLWKIYKTRQKIHLISLIWLFIAPIPAAITRDSPHALRSLMMIPPLIFIIAFGLEEFMNLVKPKKVWFGLIVIVLMFSLFKFWGNYSGDYRKNYSWSWQYGYQQAIDFTNKQSSQYDLIYFTKKYGEPHEFVLFYSKFDPGSFKKDTNLVRYKKSDWFWVDKFDKFIFINDWEVKDIAKCQLPNSICLLVTSPGNYPDNSEPLHIINFLDGQKAFDIVKLP